MDNRNTPPGRVSPLIRTARWGFLLFGVAYGAARNSRLNKKERARLDELERTRPQREAKEREEKLRKAKEEQESLNKAVGSIIFADAPTK